MTSLADKLKVSSEGPDAALLDQGLPSRIADRLATAIIEGDLEPGTRLSEPELAEAFGTSRTPVREALRALERDSLITHIPRRGAHVSVIDAERVTEVYVCRAYLYGLAAKLATTEMTAEELSELEGLCDEMGEAVDKGDQHEFFHLNVSFHVRVSELAANAMLLRMVEQLGRVTLRLRYLSVTIPGRLEASYEWHRRLVEAFRKGDAGAAERVVRLLIRDAGIAILTTYYEDEVRADYLASVLTPPD